MMRSLLGHGYFLKIIFCKLNFDWGIDCTYSPRGNRIIKMCLCKSCLIIGVWSRLDCSRLWKCWPCFVLLAAAATSFEISQIFLPTDCSFVQMRQCQGEDLHLFLPQVTIFLLLLESTSWRFLYGKYTFLDVPPTLSDEMGGLPIVDDEHSDAGLIPDVEETEELESSTNFSNVNSVTSTTAQTSRLDKSMIKLLTTSFSFALHI